MESDSSNIGDIWPNLIIMKKQISAIHVENILESFKLEVLKIIDKYAKNYEGKKKKKKNYSIFFNALFRSNLFDRIYALSKV